MKRNILLIVILLAAFTLVGCSESAYKLVEPQVVDSRFIVKVGGTPGLRFHGHYAVVTAGGGSTSRSVEGTVPVEYNVKGKTVACAFQKQEERGTLKVEIIKDGKVVGQSETSAAYGMVTIASE